MERFPLMGARTMKTFGVAIIAIGLVSDSFATAQVGERLLYKGETNRLCTLPLEPYLKERNLRIYVFGPPRKVVVTTACWRGYIGTWQIKDDFLWLLGVQNLDGEQVPLS